MPRRIIPDTLLGAIFARLLTGHRADHPVANPVTDAPRVRRAGRLSLLLIAAAVIAAVGLAGVKAWLHARAQGTYFGFYTQGDKPAIGLQVDLDDMVCTGATLFILSPDYPADRTGIAYPLTIGSASHTGFWCYTTIMNRGKTQKWEYIGTEQRLGDDVITVDLLPEGENTGASQRIVMHRGGPGELKAPPPTAKDD